MHGLGHQLSLVWVQTKRKTRIHLCSPSDDPFINLDLNYLNYTKQKRFIFCSCGHRMFSNTPEVWSFPEADRKPSTLVRAQPFLRFRSHRRAMSVLMQENWSPWSKAPSAKRTKKEFLQESYRKKVHQRIGNNSDHQILSASAKENN